MTEYKLQENTTSLSIEGKRVTEEELIKAVRKTGLLKEVIKEIYLERTLSEIKVNEETVEEQIRRYGQERMPFAFMSRSVAGTIGGMLVLAVPGSTNGAKESMDALLPHIFHAYKVIRDERHD